MAPFGGTGEQEVLLVSSGGGPMEGPIVLGPETYM
jgi:hypothetical protein